jgi:AcrR family transcriptional regulator
MPRRGPRTDNADTRQEILDAARELFAEHGYDRTTIRGVARTAGVDPALIHHYFGTKADLFTASVAIPFPVAQMLPDAIGAEPAVAGERVARLFFTVWEEPETRAALLGQLRQSLATGEPPVIAGFISREVLGRVADVMEGADQALRAELVASHLLGVALLRYVVRIEPIASADPEQIIGMVASRIQTYFTPNT